MTDQKVQEVKSASTELELDGKISIVEKDKDGNVISRDELDSELMLNALMTVLQEAIEFPTELLEEESE